MNNKVWKDIKGYKGLYKINNMGEVISYKLNKDGYLLKPKIDRYGYKIVALLDNGTRKYIPIHKLVAQAFIPNSENKPQVNHKDGNKLNNCVENLEWCTNKENIQHAWDTGLQKKRFGKDNDKSKTVYQYNNKLDLVGVYESTRDAERKTGCDHAHISACCIGKTKQAYGYKWSYVNKSEVI